MTPEASPVNVVEEERVEKRLEEEGESREEDGGEGGNMCT